MIEIANCFRQMHGSAKRLARGGLIGLFCCLLLAPMVSANALDSGVEYSKGLSAYLSGDYILAQNSWLKSAQAKDAKSMFNLGLLHQQGKLADASVAKAEKWFRLAGQNGYAAGYYHLAMWLKQRDASAIEIQQLLISAANAGFAPARKYRSSSVAAQQTVTPRLTPMARNEPIEPLEKAPAQSYQSERHIKDLQAQHWTIQILAFEERDKVLRFIDTHALHAQAAYFSERNDQAVLYKLIYGSYASKQQAEAARNRLPAALIEYGPWLRSVAGVQAIINKQ